MKNSIIVFLFLLTSFSFAQEVDSTFVVIDSTIVDSVEVTFDKNSIQSLGRTEDVIDLKKLDKIFSN